MPIDSIFVYGTLKQNHLRAVMWPCKPKTIRSAMIQASLWDTGPYPAILEGDDWVLGELWSFDRDKIDDTLRVLDEVEGYDAARSDNLYIRIEVDAWLDDRSNVKAYAYRFAVACPLPTMRRMPPWTNYAGRACTAWPDPLSRVPRTLAEE